MKKDKKIYLSESELRSLIKNSVKRIIKEAVESEYPESEVKAVNEDEQDYYNHSYTVELSKGGYFSNIYQVFANHEPQALEILVAWCESNDPNILCDSEYQLSVNDGATEEELDEQYIYIDGTEYGAKSPHYIDGVHIAINKIY